MTVADLSSAVERAVLERVRVILTADRSVDVIGIRSGEPPEWHGAAEQELDGVTVSIEACPSVLAVLDALARHDTATGTLVILTDRPEPELGNDVLVRLHRGKLFEASRHTLLDDLLGARRLDPRIRRQGWLVDALVDLAHAAALPSTQGTTLSMSRATDLVLDARLGLDADRLDLPQLVLALDDPATRTRWRAAGPDERGGLGEHLAAVYGRAAVVVAELALHRDDVLAELLVADVLTAPPEADAHAAVRYGRFTQSRFGTAQPVRADLRDAGHAAVSAVGLADTPRTTQQLRRADALLEELGAAELAAHSAVLPRGFTERLALAADQLTEERLAAVAEHRSCAEQPHRLERLRCAARLQRWTASGPDTTVASGGDALRRHARELSWVDRALAQVRAGDADPRVAATFDGAGRPAERLRAELDRRFAPRLVAMAEAPGSGQLAVETLLPDVVAPLAAKHRVLLIVVDGMSGAVATELGEALTDQRGGWTEVVRAADGGREAVLAALPTETGYSRTSLLTASLQSGTQDEERRAFAGHRFWPSGGATLVHKAGIAGRDGADLGADLEGALTRGDRVVGVVLNAVDDSLKQGRQSMDPSWTPSDIPGLPQLLGRAAETERVVVLVSDHGHVLEHGSQHRPAAGGGARWRPAGGEPAGADEVAVAGSRVLVPEGRAVLAATEALRYGARAHGYHGGGTLAEVAIPLLVLLPPGLDGLDGWYPHSAGAPPWWSAASTPAPAPVAVPSRRRRVEAPPEPDLFASEPSQARGGSLVASDTFRGVHGGLPANRVPTAEVFAAVVDALTAAGGRLPVAAVLQAAQASGRNPRGLVTALGRVLNGDGFEIISLVDDGRAVRLDLELLDEQFPPEQP